MTDEEHDLLQVIHAEPKGRAEKWVFGHAMIKASKNSPRKMIKLTA